MQGTQQCDREEKLHFGSGGGKGRRRWGKTEVFGAASKDGFLVCFSHGKDGEPAEDGEEDNSPLCPLPSFTDSNKGANNGSVTC